MPPDDEPGILGAGNHRIARMNGGYSSRPCLGLTLRLMEVWVHTCFTTSVRDDRIQGSAASMPMRHTTSIPRTVWLSLLWLEPWDGTNSSLRLWSILGPLLHRDLPQGAPRMPERPNRWTDGLLPRSRGFRCCRSKRGCGRSLDAGDSVDGKALSLSSSGIPLRPPPKADSRREGLSPSPRNGGRCVE